MSGHVKRPGNYEVEMAKTTFRDLIYDPVYGGGIRDDSELKAFIPGGASSPWFGPEHLDLPLDQDEVGKNGTMLGSGSIVAMDDTTCMVRAAWRLIRFFHRESCGQCTPCREGRGWLEKILARIEGGQGRESDLDLLMDVCDNIAPGLDLASPPDDDLPARPVDPEPDRLGHPDVPRRVPGPHQGAEAARMPTEPPPAKVTINLDGRPVARSPAR